jgi:hypothetical protein
MSLVASCSGSTPVRIVDINGGRGGRASITTQRVMVHRSEHVCRIRLEIRVGSDVGAATCRDISCSKLRIVRTSPWFHRYIERPMRRRRSNGNLGSRPGCDRPVGNVDMPHKVKRSSAMNGLDALIFGLVALIVLDVLALKFGRDSRTPSDARCDWR